MISDAEALEIAQGVHYHAWALMEHGTHLKHPAKNGIHWMRQLGYGPARQPHRSRQTARRHAKKMAEPEYGTAGYMALICDGGASCPFMFEAFRPGFNPHTLKFEGMERNADALPETDTAEA